MYLKSNMDRFIDLSIVSSALQTPNLKSNMDRFIGNSERVVVS